MTEGPTPQRRRDDPGFQQQIDDLRSEQLEQGIEQDAQAGVQKRQAVSQVDQVARTKELTDWSVGFFVIVVLFSAVVFFLLGVVAAQYASYNGWWGAQCFWGLPC